MSVREDEEDEIGIGDDGVGGGVDEEMEEKQRVGSKNVTSAYTTYLR